MDDAEPLSGCPSNGLSHDPKGEEVLTVMAMSDTSGPALPCHPYTKECQVGVEQRNKREAAVTSVLVLRQQYSVHGNVLERVEVFKYLGRLLAQDDDDIRTIQAKLWKARQLGPESGRCFGRRMSPQSCVEVLQIGRTSRFALWQRDVGPLQDRPGEP